MSSIRPRLAVLGLDGLPLDLARDLAEQGLAPNLARLALDSRARAMDAELPELSPVNWTSLATAAGPGEHGIYGFTRLDPASYAISLADSRAVACPTIFDRLGRAGLTSKVLNLPNTYPARPLRGMMVAGFTAPELSGAVWPPFLAGPLNEMGYVIEPDTAPALADPSFLPRELTASLDRREKALDLLWPDLAWDLFVFVITETDRLFHFLFPAVADERHPLHRECLAFITRLDTLVGGFLDRWQALPEPKRLISLADHGFTKLITEVDLNAWLRRKGLLHLAGPPAHELDASIVAPHTTALALDPGRIYVHDKKRFSRAALDPTLVPETIQTIRRALLDLTFEGRPVMRAVHRGRDIYSGTTARLAPDLVCEPEPGFDLKAKFDRDEIFGTFGRTGTHTAHGSFFWDSEGARPQRTRDAGTLILDFFGVSRHNPPPRKRISPPDDTT